MTLEELELIYNIVGAHSEAGCRHTQPRAWKWLAPYPDVQDLLLKIEYEIQMHIHDKNL